MRVGIIGDIHEPFTYPTYLDFCRDTFRRWHVNQSVVIGDAADHHAISPNWEHDPNGLSAEGEGLLCRSRLSIWHRTFRGAKACIGNHDERHYRTARKAGLPDRYLKTYREIFDTPTWDWQFEHVIDGVLYTHGTGTSGKDAAFNLAIQRRMSVVIGHVHAFAGVKWHTNPRSRIFGMNVGCGIDCSAYAFAYGKSSPVRPVLGCGIVIDGEQAYFEPMPIGRGRKYDRSKRKS